MPHPPRGAPPPLFQLNNGEFGCLKSQFVTLNKA